MKIDKLKILGLSDYEARCYLALLQEDKLLGKDISSISGVPPTSVYRNLDTLIKKGFVEQISDNPKVFSAIDPDVAVRNIIKKKEDDLKRLEIESISELSIIKKSNIEKREIAVEPIKKNDYLNEYKKLINSSKKEIYLISDKDLLLNLSTELLKLIKNISNLKIIITKKIDNAIISKLKDSNIKLRYYPLDSLSLLISDNNSGILNYVDNNSIFSLKDTSLINTHKDYFENLWKKSTLL